MATVMSTPALWIVMAEGGSEGVHREFQSGDPIPPTVDE